MIRSQAFVGVRARACGAIAAALALLGAGVLAARPAAASTKPGVRVTVALFGDSVTQGLLIPDFQKRSLTPQLLRDLTTSGGYQAGGPGLVPAAPFSWRFNAEEPFGQGPTPPGGWATVGSELSPGFDGPSAYSAVTASPTATATTTVSEPDVDVLYTTTDLNCSFTVTAAGRSWTISTYAAGPASDAQSAITLPPGSHQLTVHGPGCGILSFDGIVAHRPVPPGKVQVEIDNDGHSGQAPWIDFNPRVQQALAGQQYNVSVFLWGYIAELVGNQSMVVPYTQDMEARAKLARAHGGACLIVQPTPILVKPSAVTLVDRVNRTIARQSGCTYTTVLAHLWPTAQYAAAHGLLLIDDVHPTAAGYTLIARALAPVVQKLVRAQLR